jgi:hypothetical protein
LEEWVGCAKVNFKWVLGAAMDVGTDVADIVEIPQGPLSTRFSFDELGTKLKKVTF